jgi:DNA processing protein
MENKKQVIEYLRLIRADGVGPTTFDKLAAQFGNVEQALEAMHTVRYRGKALLPLSEAKALEEYNALLKKKGYFILKDSQKYGEQLRDIHDAPPLLSALGDLSLLQRPKLAIIGARNASVSGRKLAAQIARDLGQAGFVIVSGLARGIDAAAHEAALETGTIAVLANGVDVIYPPENKKLYESIADRGLLLSENPFGIEPNAQLFPRRNRIVSDLCQGVIIIEAAKQSGSLITARFALDQGREVFAIPGNPLDPRAHGPNSLIKHGQAYLVESAEDILQALNSFLSPAVERALKALDTPTEFRQQEPVSQQLLDFTDTPKQTASMTGDQAHHTVLACLSHTPCSIDDLVSATQLPVQTILSVLLHMELTNQIQRLSGNRVVLS